VMGIIIIHSLKTIVAVDGKSKTKSI